MYAAKSLDLKQIPCCTPGKFLHDLDFLFFFGDFLGAKMRRTPWDEITHEANHHLVGRFLVHVFFSKHRRFTAKRSIVYVYLEPICPLFWGLDPQKQGSFGSRYVYSTNRGLKSSKSTIPISDEPFLFCFGQKMAIFPPKKKPFVPARWWAHKTCSAMPWSRRLGLRWNPTKIGGLGPSRGTHNLHFRGYNNPYFGGWKPSFFMVLASKGCFSIFRSGNFQVQEVGFRGRT